MNLKTITIQLLIAFALLGCIPHSDNESLTHIESMQNADPQSALDSLRAIYSDQLTEHDRHYRDFLMVKLSDKAYVSHESDSLIMDVLAYESDHQGNGRYAEALYYAGRVYTDLGDFPMALSYYQQARDAIGDTERESDLKERISSQYALLLTYLQLYEEALPHINTSLGLSRDKNDTVNIINALQLLAGTYMKMHDYEQAQRLYKEAYTMAGDKYNYHAAKSRMYLAQISNTLNHTDSALFYIKDLAGNVHPSMRKFALSISGNVFLNAGIKDSAFMCARELIASGDSISRELGYDILLTDELEEFIPSDSLRQYINDYYGLLSSRFNANSASLAMTQQSMYNYKTHVREKELAEKNNRSLKTAIMWLVLLSAVLTCVILLVRNRSKTRIIELQYALTNIRTLKAELERQQTIKPQSPDESATQSTDVATETESIPQITLVRDSTANQLRIELQSELMQIYYNAPDDIKVADGIVKSEAYRQFIDIAHKGDMVHDLDPLWSDLEKEVLKESPHFRNNLSLLGSGKLSNQDIHTAILIKCGFRPVDMKTIFGKSNGAIISRRDALSRKVLDKKMEAKVITGIIQLL